MTMENLRLVDLIFKVILIKIFARLRLWQPNFKDVDNDEEDEDDDDVDEDDDEDDEDDDVDEDDDDEDFDQVWILNH